MDEGDFFPHELPEVEAGFVAVFADGPVVEVAEGLEGEVVPLVGFLHEGVHAVRFGIGVLPEFARGVVDGCC